MKVLVVDKFEKNGLEGLKAAGCVVDYRPETRDEALVAAIRDSAAEVLVVRGTEVTAAMLEAGKLTLIVRAGAGFNTIDVAAASQKGIYVSNCPGKNAIAVAELTMGLILALDRRIPDNVADLRAGRWNKQEFSKAKGLYGRTLGVLGLGSIGLEVVRRAAAFGMPVVAWSRRYDGEYRAFTADELRDLGLDHAARLVPIRLTPTPADVAGRAEILTVHVALGSDTTSLVGSSVLARLPAGAIFVNTARAEVVDRAALETAVRERGLRVGLDVFPGEPAAGTAEFDFPFVKQAGVYGTHHIGASTEQAQEAIAAETVRIVRQFRQTGRVPNCVNLARRTPATHRLIVRHRDRPGVLAWVLNHLREAGINVQEMDNVVFEGAHAATASIHLDAAPEPGLLAKMLSGNDNILDLRLVNL